MTDATDTNTAAPNARAATGTRPETRPATPQPRRATGFAALDLDTRLLGMIGAFVVICLAFHLASDGRFVTPRNLFNLTIQTASVAIMATGMVFIIVMRHIDLSVGSVLATCSAVMAMVQTAVMPDWLGLGLGHPLTRAPAPVGVARQVEPGRVLQHQRPHQVGPAGAQRGGHRAAHRDSHERDVT